MTVLWFGAHPLGWPDWLGLFGHFAMLSLLAVGGAMTTAPDMHRYLVAQRGWLDDAQFTDAVALAQAAPGPNLLFVVVLGFNAAGLAGALATLAGTLLPSTTLALVASRWGHAHREDRIVRSFTAGLAPISVGLLLATGWLLAQPSRTSWVAAALVVGTLGVASRVKLNPLWLIGTGAALGAAGWV